MRAGCLFAITAEHLSRPNVALCWRFFAQIFTSVSFPFQARTSLREHSVGEARDCVLLFRLCLSETACPPRFRNAPTTSVFTNSFNSSCSPRRLLSGLSIWNSSLRSAYRLANRKLTLSLPKIGVAVIITHFTVHRIYQW